AGAVPVARGDFMAGAGGRDVRRWRRAGLAGRAPSQARRRAPVPQPAFRNVGRRHWRFRVCAAAVAGARLMITPLSPSEIGVALRKNFPVATLAIIDPGSADLGQMEAEEQSE
ncbi:MAG: hypothetical protein QXV62_04890, partial [Nitrososphaerota archaeon]